MKICISFCVMIFLITFHIAYGQEGTVTYGPQTIPITYSSSMKDVIFDGKWTFTREWKESTLTGFSGGYIRTAHFDNNIYVMIDAVGVTNFKKNSDMAMVCFDSKNEKSSIPNSNDYCFSITLGGGNPITLQGEGKLSLASFKKITSPKDLIAIGNISDQNDRYTAVPHQSYEFRIPVDLIGRSDSYGFYVLLFNSVENKFYSWPDISNDSLLKIPSPDKWGELVSPDKSLPEFPWPAFTLVSSLLVTIYLTRRSI